VFKANKSDLKTRRYLANFFWPFFLRTLNKSKTKATCVLLFFMREDKKKREFWYEKKN